MYYLYLRKSRSDGLHETIPEILARHERILQDYAIRHFGAPVPEEAVLREIVSGETIQNRPVMQKLLVLIQNPDCEAVLVTDPQRLSRGDLHDCGTVTRAFQYSRTKIITPAHTYDLEQKFDRKFFESELLHGNDYLEYTKEILLRGRLASVREGNYIGSSAPFGYDRIQSGGGWTLAENQESDAVRLIFRAYLHEQKNPAEICRELDRLHIAPRKNAGWSAASIRSILKNPVYAGKIRWNCRKTVRQYQDGQIRISRPIAPAEEQILLPGRHPALISEQEFQEVQNLLKSRQHPRRKKNHLLANPFAGICHCTCGAAMLLQKSRNASPRLVCRNQTKCHQKSICYPEFENKILTALREQFPNFSCSGKDFPELSGRLKRQQMTELQNQQEKLYELLEKGIYSEQIFLTRQNLLTQKLQALESIPEPEPHFRNLNFHALLKQLENPDIPAEQKNQFLRALIQDIIYSQEKIIILLRISSGMCR